MSRTYYKRPETFEEYYSHWNLNEDGSMSSPWGYVWSKEEVEQLRVHYKYRSAKYYTYGLPKWYRNQVNRKRRRKDKQEIWKEVNIDDYEEQCSKWSCKDSEAWGYW